MEENKVKLNTTGELKVVKQKKKNNRYAINIIVILLITFGYTIVSLWNDFPSVLEVFQSNNTDYRVIPLILFIVVLKFLVEGLILYIFARLYTPSYKYHRGVANAFVGQFYSDITPSSTGGQFAQVKTFANQGVPVAISASILVMHFIIYQGVIIIYGFVSILVNVKDFALMPPVSLGSLNIPVWIFSLLGFIINLATIIGLFLLSHSKLVHKIVINFGVDFAAKLRFVKDPVKTKQKLYVSTENFRIELRRLSANLPATFLIAFLFVIKLTVGYSITYFSAMMLDPSIISTVSFFDVIMKSNFLANITGFMPIPGAAGIAEFFFELLYANTFGNNNARIKAIQIAWRFFSFYISLIIGGIVTAFYRSSMADIVDEEGRVQTLQDVQSVTFAERKESSDTAYETSQFSIKEIQRRVKGNKRKDDQ